SENAHGAGKNAIYHNNAGLSVRPTIKLNVAANRTITFFDPLENRPYGGLMSVVKNGVGAVRFDATGYSNTNDRWSPIYARTQINEGTFEVANGAIYGMRAADVSSSEDSTFTMAPSTMLKGGGVTSWLRADQMMLEGVIFDLAGERLLSPSGQRNTFRIDSKNVSLDGSTVVFNTVLDGGSLPNTDKLIFSVNPFSTQTGPLTGNVAITIHNAGGVGGQTTGDGILLIEAIDGGELDATFTLSGGPITAGNYEYDLVQSNTHVYLQSTRSNGGGGGSKTAAIPTLGTGALVALVLVLGVVTLGTTRDKVKWMQV
ncbi:MAG: hypothetical protein LBI16_03320, partial [Burkholderiales bacterium]|nr:hypothetical protein [Burkholderiales bacterium]